MQEVHWLYNILIQTPNNQFQVRNVKPAYAWMTYLQKMMKVEKQVCCQTITETVFIDQSQMDQFS